MTDISKADLPEFLNAIATDSTFTPTIRLGLASLGWWLALCIQTNTTAGVQQAWADLISVYGGSWLTLAVQTKVLTYASTYNIPLT